MVYDHASLIDEDVPKDDAVVDDHPKSMLWSMIMLLQSTTGRNILLLQKRQGLLSVRTIFREHVSFCFTTY